MEPAAIEYDGTPAAIPGIPTRADLVRAGPTGAADAAAVERQVGLGGQIVFMPVDVLEQNEWVRGVGVFKLHLFGILTNGAKAHVILDGVAVFFDVRAGEPPAKGSFADYLRELLCAAGLAAIRVEDVMARLAREYCPAPVAWVRLHFNNTQDRKRALEAVRRAGHETATDDMSHFNRFVGRVNNLTYTDWCTLRTYAYTRGGAHPGAPDGSDAGDDGHDDGYDESDAAVDSRSPLCEHVFRLDVKHFRPFVDPAMAPAARKQREDVRIASPRLVRDRTLVMAWDIETYLADDSGALPLATNPAARVFMICVSLHWKDDPAPLHRVCLVDIPTAPDPGWDTVVCRDEAGLLQAFAALFRQFAPDVITGFNCGGYDWPFIIEKARLTDTLGGMVNTMTALPKNRPTDTAAAMDWNVKHAKIKIGGGADACAVVEYLSVPGCLVLDTRVVFQQIFPKAEVVGQRSSLKFYLEACRLEGKADMPIREMWQIYKARDAVRMREVAHYCVIDAVRVQQLLVARGVLGRRREVSSLSQVSLSDAIYYADSHKVTNMLVAGAFRRGMLATMNPSEHPDRGKYPGAWVFHPVRGLVPDPTAAGMAELEAARAAYTGLAPDAALPPGWGEAVHPDGVRDDARLRAALAAAQIGRPVAGLDFASLYPSLIMAYNLSPDRYVADPARAAQLEAAGEVLHRVSFEMGEELIQGAFVRHNGRPEEEGLFVSILADLFEQRKTVKRLMAPIGAMLEALGVLTGRAAACGDFGAALRDELAAGAGPPAYLALLAETAKTGEAGWRAAIAAVANDYEFRNAVLNSKQLALKVYMNTFYGSAGSVLSPFFLLQLAGGVTSAGQYNIKKVADYVVSQGFQLRYGDTDSVYVSCPPAFFRAADADYAYGRTGREAYWTAQVVISMAALDTLRDSINALLKADNGTTRLQMAYEEVLFPAVFTGKKKYFGIAHVSTPNFRPKGLFVRGIEVVKMGQTKMTKAVGQRVMDAAVRLDNARGLVQIVEDVLREALENGAQWGFADFVQTLAWKPDRNNQVAQKFISRMRARVLEEAAANARRAAAGLDPLPAVYYIPDAGDRFEYVLVAPGEAFDVRGRKVNPSVGDMMEYASVVKAKGLEPDVSQYLARVLGLCARFINSDPRFLPPGGGGGDDKACDSESLKLAKKHLDGFLAALNGASPGVVAKRGHAYKRAWKAASAVCGGLLHRQLGAGAAAVLDGGHLDWSMYLEASPDEVVSAWAAAAQALASDSADPRAAAAVLLRLGVDRLGRDCAPPGAPPGSGPPAGTAMAKNLYRVARILGGTSGPGGWSGRAIPDRVLAVYVRREAQLRAGLAGLVPALSDLATRYEMSLADCVKACRLREHASQPYLDGSPVAAAAGAGAAPPGAAPPEAAPAEAPPIPEALPFLAADAELLRGVYRDWIALAGVYRARDARVALLDTVRALQAARLKADPHVSADAARAAIAGCIRSLPPLGLQPIGGGGY